jgi:hypothetical protein
MCPNPLPLVRGKTKLAPPLLIRGKRWRTSTPPDKGEMEGVSRLMDYPG